MQHDHQSPMNTSSPLIKPHPLDVAGSIKIMLGQAASDILAAHGDCHFAIISHPDATSPPEASGRLILTCLPLPRQTLDNATRVALGTMAATRSRKPATAGTAPTTAQPDE